MPVNAIGDYSFAPRDRVENFHGNILVFVHWERHLMFAAPVAVPLSPDMPFAAVQEQLLPELYGRHPDFAQVNWADVEWELDGEDFQPDPSAGIAAQGFGHKSAIRFRTPGLSGLAGAHF